MGQQVRRRTGTTNSQDAGQKANIVADPSAEIAGPSGGSGSWVSRPFLLLGLLLVINIFRPMDPAVTISNPIVRQGSEVGQIPEPAGEVASVVEEYFPCGGVKCHAWLVLPKKPLTSAGSTKPPVVVMGHGLACMKDMGLYTYAVAFAEIGLASYLIDYRGFGLSDGEPRNVVDAAAHASDFVDATTHIMADSRVDGSRVALWGTSLAGGHAVQAAGMLGDKVAAVISQAPALDAVQSFIFNLKNRGVTSMLRCVFAAIVDAGRGLLGMTPAYIKIFGREDEMVALPISQTELDQYFGIHSVNQSPPRPYLGGWINKTPPRSLLTFLLYRPVTYASQVHGPVLYVVSSWDSVVPLEVVDTAMTLSQHPRSRKHQVEGGHFQLYKETVHLALPEMVKFLQAELA